MHSDEYHAYLRDYHQYEGSTQAPARKDWLTPQEARMARVVQLLLLTVAGLATFTWPLPTLAGGDSRVQRVRRLRDRLVPHRPRQLPSVSGTQTNEIGPAAI